jgi:hypothetical protein
MIAEKRREKGLERREERGEGPPLVEKRKEK